MSSTNIPNQAIRQGSISHAADQPADEAEVRKLINARIDAIRARDVNAATANVAEDVAVFDVVDAFAQMGLEAMRERAIAWFSSFDDKIGVEVRHLIVSVSGDTAFAHSLNRYSGKLKNGGDLDMSVRVTLCLKKLNDHWIITHEHNSVPFDSKSGMAIISTGAATATRDSSKTLGPPRV